MHQLSAADVKTQRRMFNSNVQDRDNTSSLSPTPRTTQVAHMNAETLDVLPKPRNLLMYEDNTDSARRLRYEVSSQRLSHLRDAIRGFEPSPSLSKSSASFKLRRSAIHAISGSPPTQPTVVHMMSPTRSGSASSIYASSQSPSTTPESVHSRLSGTFDLRDLYQPGTINAPPIPNRPQQGEAKDPSPTHDTGAVAATANGQLHHSTAVSHTERLNERPYLMMLSGSTHQ